MPMARDSEFWQLYRHELLRYREHGLLQRAKNIWIDQPISMSRGDEKTDDPETTVGYESVVFPFVVLVSGGTFSIMVAIYEYLMNWAKVSPHLRIWTC